MIKAAAIFFLIINALYGSETVHPDVNASTAITVSFEHNNSTVFEGPVVVPNVETDANATLSLESNGTNWFFYRDFVDTIDQYQAYWSHRILVFSSNLDQMLYEFYEEDESDDFIRQPVSGIREDDNATLPSSIDAIQESNATFPSSIDAIQERNATLSADAGMDKGEQTYVMSTWYDEFFKDETYLDSTNRSYIRIRGGHEFDKRGENSWIRRITARIRLPKTSGRFQLFVADDVKEDGTPVEKTGTAENQGIGVKYFMPSFFKHFNASASVGLSKITNPYAKAHVEHPFLFKSWLIRPTQKVKYSYENEFQEWTNLYFDKKISNREMFRLLLQRSTQSRVVGMKYLAQISYLNTLKHGVGFNNYIAVTGRTKDLKAPYENGDIPQEGVYNYAVGMVWKQSFFRDYLFYQLEPIVEFHEEYEYMVNYRFRVTLELYFGKI